MLGLRGGRIRGLSRLLRGSRRFVSRLKVRGKGLGGTGNAGGAWHGPLWDLLQWQHCYWLLMPVLRPTIQNLV
jgi:hypothetical protein